MGLVLQGDGLVVGGEDDFMLPHHVAHAQGVDADLVGLALVLAGAAEDVFRVRPLLLHGVGQKEGGAAGGVGLAVVVGLDDLHVAAAEDGGGLLHQAGQEGHAHGHVIGLEDGDGLGPLLQDGELLGGVAGGGGHQGQVAGLAVVHQLPGAGVVGEVDNHVGRAGVVGQGGIDPLAAGPVHGCRQGGAGLGNDPAHLLAHAPQSAVYDDVHGVCYLSVKSTLSQRAVSCGFLQTLVLGIKVLFGSFSFKKKNYTLMPRARMRWSIT